MRAGAKLFSAVIVSMLGLGVGLFAADAFAGGNNGGGGGCGGGSGCGGGYRPPQVHIPQVPPINIGIPNINISIPRVNTGGGGGCGGGHGCGGGGHHDGGHHGGHGGARASAEAHASAEATVIVNNNVENNVYMKGGSSTFYYINRTPTPLGSLNVETGRWELREGTVVKALRAVCVAADGTEHPASRVDDNTWLDIGYEGELYRCIEGTHLRVTIGAVVESEKGMAAVFDGGETLECGAREALGHWKGGMIKCVPRKEMPECTERRLLRKNGAGDIFFTMRMEVRVRVDEAVEDGMDLSGMYLDGGVGQSFGW